jgi:lysophospholipase L1-like esterase
MSITRWITAALAISILALLLQRNLISAQDAAATAQPPVQNSATTPGPRQQGNWMRHHEQINERAKQGDVELLFIGDSITDFWQTPATASARPQGGGGKDVWEKYYGNRKAMNAGISGDRTQHVLWRLDHGNLDGIHPKLAVVMIGTNNAPQDGNTGGEIGEGIKAIIGKLREKLPETKVLLLAIFPRSDKPAENEQMKKKIAKANQIAASLADNKMIYFMDIGPRFLDAEGNIPTDIVPDHLHPNAKGYEIWAKAIEPKVAELMGEKN